MRNEKYIRGKVGAMEMSVGTMVTIVLLMVVLVLGIFFIQKIFSSGTNAIDSINSEVQSQIQQLFAQQGTTVAIYPTSRRITLNQGDNKDGFAFAIKNQNTQVTTFGYTIAATDVSNCPGITKDMATGFLVGGQGQATNLASGALFGPDLVTFIIPSTMPLCTMEYDLSVTNPDGSSYANQNFFVTIQ